MASDEEIVLADWQEPAITTTPLTSHFMVISISGGIVVALIMVALGYFLSDANFYWGAPVAVLAGLVIPFQKRMPVRQLRITLTNQHLIVGERSYALTDLAGFWLAPESGYTAVNVESKRPTLLPITFLYPDTDLDKISQDLVQALPEIEPRHNALSEGVSRFFRL